MKLVWKLLKENISKPQLIGFFFANLIGMAIILLAFQFYFDISPLFNDKNTLFKKDYFTITKKVSLISNIAAGATGFSQNEIDDLKQQAFVKDVGTFTPSQFNVFAGINSPGAGIGFNTEMFFESVPDKFIDVKSEDWHFSEMNNSIPIILPKDYLDLYNFGFAEANSMPKITEGLIGLINLDISIYGKNGLRKQMTGRIVGFSSRINTILVPDSFMIWANLKFGGKTGNPARLIVEISNIADPNLANYFKEKGYEISGDKTTAGKMSYLLKLIVSIVVLVGIIICALSFFVLTLSIYLLLEKNMSKMKTLRLIGYRKSIIVRPYELLAASLNSIILVISVIIVFIARIKYLNIIGKLYSTDGTSFPVYTVIIGLGIFVLMSLLNIYIIRSKIK